MKITARDRIAFAAVVSLVIGAGFYGFVVALQNSRTTKESSAAIQKADTEIAAERADRAAERAAKEQAARVLEMQARAQRAQFERWQADRAGEAKAGVDATRLAASTRRVDAEIHRLLDAADAEVDLAETLVRSRLENRFLPPNLKRTDEPRFYNAGDEAAYKSAKIRLDEATHHRDELTRRVAVIISAAPEKQEAMLPMLRRGR